MIDSVKFSEQRVMFETWCSNKALHSKATNAKAMAALLLLKYDDTGVYVNNITRSRWKAWLASAKANGVNLQISPESPTAV